MSKQLTPGQRAILDGLLASRERALRLQLAQRVKGVERVERLHDAIADQASDSMLGAPELEVEVALTDIDSRDLAAVLRARQRVHDPEFGICADCGTAIPFDRLSVEPEATRCVECESARERKH